MGKKNTKAGENLRVVVRVRPLKDDERKRLEQEFVNVDIGTNQVIVKQPVGDPHVWAFDAVYNNSFSQTSIFDRECRPLVDQVMEGFNATVFAYGQSGSGKTWTMTGPIEEGRKELFGMMPQTVHYLFDSVKKATTKTISYKVKCQYVELYNGKTRDLLCNDQETSLEIREGPNGFYVKGVNIKEVQSAQACIDEFMQGTARRRTAATGLNEHSSRSHALFSLMLEQFDYELDQSSPTTSSSKMIIVDLAGSEKLGKTGAQGETMVEGCNINASLSALGTCIDRIVTGGAGAHIPYRANPLTRLLKDSLGGNAKTVMFANIGPSHVNIAESMSTLRFADNAKKIENKPVKNRDPMKQLIEDLQAQIAELKKRVSGDWDPDTEKRLQEKIDTLTLENDSFKQSISRGSEGLLTEKQELQKAMAVLEEKLGAATKALTETERDRDDVRSRLTIDLQHAQTLRSIATNFLRRVLSDEHIAIISQHSMPANIQRSSPEKGEDWTIGEISAYLDGFVQLYEEWRGNSYTQEDLQKEVARVRLDTEGKCQNQIEVLEAERNALLQQRDENRKQQEQVTDTTSQLRAENAQLKDENGKLKDRAEKDAGKAKKKLDQRSEEVLELTKKLDEAKSEAESSSRDLERLKRQLEESNAASGGGHLSRSGSMTNAISGAAGGGDSNSPLSKDERVRRLQIELEDSNAARKAAELRLRQLNVQLRRGGICIRPGSNDAAAMGLPQQLGGGGGNNSDNNENDEANTAFVITKDDGHIPDSDVLGLLQQQLRVQHRLQELNHNQQKKLDLLLRKYELVRTGQVTKLEMGGGGGGGGLGEVSSEALAAKQLELDTLQREMERKLDKLKDRANKQMGELGAQLKAATEEKMALEEERNELLHHAEDLEKFNQQLALEIETLRARMANQEKEAGNDANLLRKENDSLKTMVQRLEGEVEKNRLKVNELDELKRDYDKLQRLQERTEQQLREKFHELEQNHQQIQWSQDCVQQERRKVEEAEHQLAVYQQRYIKAEERFQQEMAVREAQLIQQNNAALQEQQMHFIELVEEEKEKVKAAKRKLRDAKEREARAEAKYDQLVLENENLSVRFEEQKATAQRAVLSSQSNPTSDHSASIRSMIDAQKRTMM